MRANHLRRVSLLPDTANDQLPQDSPVLWQRAESHRLADLQPPGEDFNEACGGVDLFDLAEACTACTPENHIRYITHTRAHEHKRVRGLPCSSTTDAVHPRARAQQQ